MTRKQWAPIVLIPLLGLAVAAGFLQNRSAADPYSGVRELVSDLEAGGVQCRDLTVSPPEQAEELGGEFGFCFIGKRNVNIHVYNDQDRVAEHADGNISVRGDNPNYFTSLVRGSNWVVDTYSETTSRLVQEVIGGTIQ